jgi:Gas vesicle protein G
MSLFSELVLLPLAPVRGVAWLGARVAEHAEEQLAMEHDPRRVLEEIEAALEQGELSQEDYAAAEEELLRELVPEPVFLDALGDDDRDQRDEPVGDEPVGDEPVGDEPVGDEPVGDEPVAAERPEPRP